MSVAIACTPAAPVAKKSACRIDLTGMTTNDITAYDNSIYPSSPAVTYYLTFEVGGAVEGKSYVFTPNGGKHTFDNYIFPSAGSYTVRLSKADGTSVATQAVTVS
jgi:hypothetical protein